MESSGNDTVNAGILKCGGDPAGAHGATHCILTPAYRILPTHMNGLPLLIAIKFAVTGAMIETRKGCVENLEFYGTL
jgi:hypothetical protein